MYKINTTYKLLIKSLTVILLPILSTLCYAETLPALIDNFSNTTNNTLNIPRQFMNDSIAGGSTKTRQTTSQGILSVSGNIVPPRGQLGWASSVLVLDPKGLPKDASRYTGVRLIVKIKKGNLSVSANSAKIDNFDYHSALITTSTKNTFHEIKVPFSSMKRSWSEQTELDPKTLTSLSIVAFSPQSASIDFELDEVGFYTSKKH